MTIKQNMKESIYFFYHLYMFITILALLCKSQRNLQINGPAPVYDSGTSLWHDQITGSIHPESDVSCHPFRSTHGLQIGLADNLDWIDFSALQDIDEEFRLLLLSSPYIDEARTDALCRGLKGRVLQLEQLALQRDFKESSREESELESLVLK